MTAKSPIVLGRHLVVALSFAALTAGCDGTDEIAPASPSGEPHALVRSATQEQSPSSDVQSPQVADLRSADLAVAPPEAPQDPLTLPAKSDRRTLAHILEPKRRIGVYLGLPAGWRNDDPSYLLFFPKGGEPMPAARAVAMTLPEVGFDDANLAKALRRGGTPTGLRDARWGSWSQRNVGEARLSARISEGHGQSIRGVEGERKALAVVVDVPGAPALGFVGSWAVAQPEHEAVMMEMLRALERCQIEVGRGCVGDAERKRASL